MVDAHNQEFLPPMKEEDLPDHLQIMHLGLFPIVALVVACLLAGMFIGAVGAHIIAHWLGWC